MRSCPQQRPHDRNVAPACRQVQSRVAILHARHGKTTSLVESQVVVTNGAHRLSTHVEPTAVMKAEPRVSLGTSLVTSLVGSQVEVKVTSLMGSQVKVTGIDHRWPSQMERTRGVCLGSAQLSPLA